MSDTIGSWGGLQIRLTVPEVTDVVGAMSSVLDLINIALDLGLTILQVVRTFTTTTLNPVKALLDELTSLCRGALLDLRKLGLYAHLGDYQILSRGSSLSALKGGYAQYQRRMVTRLTDKRDLRRPDFTPDTSVLALFLYTGVDVSFVNGLLDTTKFQSLRRTGSAFGRLLGMTGIVGRNTSLPTPVGLQVSYPFNPTRSSASSPALQLALASSQMLGRDTAIVSWNIAPAPGSPDTDPSPAIPPGGFLVEVSCYPKGFYAGWLAPNPSSTGGASGSGSTEGHQAYATGTYQEGDTGHPLQIFGGLDTISLSESISWDNSFNGSTIVPGATPLFFFRDPNIPETLHNPFPKTSTGAYVNQRTFFVPKSKINLQALVGGTFTLELAKQDLPLYGPLKSDGTIDLDNLTEPTEVYVRVVAVTDVVTSENYKEVKWNPLPRRSPTDEQVQLSSPFGFETKGVPSDIVKVTFPSRETDTFTLALQTALAIALLSRSDLVPPDAVTNGATAPTPEEQALSTDLIYLPTGLENAIRDLVPVVIPNPQRYFQARGSSPDSFTRDLYSKIVSLADQITASQGNIPQQVLAARLDRFNRLINWRWNDSTIQGAAGNSSIAQTVLESINISQVDPHTTVLARNVYSLPGYWENQGSSTTLDLLFQARDDFRESSFGEVGFDSSPMVYDRNRRRTWYARHLIPTEIYNLASEVLALTSARTQATGGWVAWRPFMGVSPLAANGRILQTVEGFLQASSAGVASAENAILNTISFLEQRVKEVQELIKKLDAYLELPTQVSIPDLVALPILANGTDGVTQAFLGAENKPTDGPGAYAGGLVLMGGGLPSILTDLILMILSQSQEG